jgi:hypothetical protein
MPMARPTAAAVAAAFTACVALVLPSPAAASHSADHSLPAYGLGALKAEWLAGWNAAEGLDWNGLSDLDRMKQGKIGMYRARFRQDVALRSGAYTEWTQLDNLVRQAALRSVIIQPILINMPGEVYTPPKTAAARAEFARYAEAAARRYGPGGSLWKTCNCPARPVKVWEVWNEPNYGAFWNPPSAVEYAYLLRDVRAKLRTVDPTARILFGGLAYVANTATRREPNQFLREALSTVGWNQADAVAVHTYNGNADYAVSTQLAGTVQTIKQVAGTEANGAPRLQLWLNEFGRPTTPDDPATPANEQTTSEQTQRTWQDTFMNRLLPQRAAWNLGPVMWYSLRDSHAPTSTWHRYGLRRTNSNDTDAGPKPSWTAYAGRSAAAGSLWLPTVR